MRYDTKLKIILWQIILFIEIGIRGHSSWYLSEQEAFGIIYGFFTISSLICLLEGFLIFILFILLTNYSLRKVTSIICVIIITSILIEGMNISNSLYEILIKSTNNINLIKFLSLFICILIFKNKTIKIKKDIALNYLLINTLSIVLILIYIEL